MHSFVCLFLIFLGLFSGSQVHGDSLSDQRKNFLKAERAIKKGYYRRLNELLPKLKEYPLYPYLLYKKLSKKPDSMEQIESYLAEYSDTRYPTLLRRNLLKSLASKKKWPEYISHYEKTVSPELQCFYYWALYKTGRKDEALVGAEKLWLIGRSRPKACDKLFVKFQNSEVFSTEIVWQRFGLAMDKGKPQLAKYLKQFIPKNQQKLADFWLKVHRNPRLVMGCKQWDFASPKMSRIFVHGIGRLIGKDSNLAHHVWESRKNNFNIELEQQSYIEKRLGIALAIRRNPKAAQFLANINIAQAHTELREWRVRNALLVQDWQSARLYLEQLQQPDQVLPQWLYWRARSFEALGQLDEALKIYADVAKSRSFYSFLAADRLEQDYEWGDRPVAVSEVEIEQLENRKDFAAVFEFKHFGRNSMARREWWHIIRKLSTHEILVAAKLAERRGWNHIAIFTIAKVKYWDDLALRFPVLFEKTITDHANRQGLDPSLVYGLIRQESVFNQHAQSRVGARGLMQIMPATGRSIARSLKEKWSSSRILYKPDVNVRYGTSYLKNLLDQFDQNYALSAAGYNAGEHRVKRWLPVDKPMPSDIWIENIPFKETRHYVKTVLANASIYHKRLNDKLLRVSSLTNTVATKNKSKVRQKKLPHLKSCNQ